SKNFLAGEWDTDRIALRKPEALEELQLTWKLGAAATALNTKDSTLTLATGETITYDGLIIATGGNVRRLPNQPSLSGIHVLRSIDDAEHLRQELTEGARVVVIGAGFIGLEAAATATKRGASVTVLEGLDAPLIRALGPEMGGAVGEVHTRNGVTIRCGVSVASINGTTRVESISLANGEVVPADVVIVGIGVAPATSWCEGSGLTIADGIVCNAQLNAGPKNVFAAGDVLRWPNHLFTDVEETMRVEHWTNAAEQGAQAAKNLLAALNNTEQTPYEAVPFFWSDQFDARIQFLGRVTKDAVAAVVAGNPAEGKWCAMYVANNRLVGVLGVSMPKLVMPSRALLSTHTSVEDARAHFARVTAPPPAQ
ncbi:MAG: FAD-dependent oxidoreductase, partial [Actinobacteria bacterium]|nr:FAD-dependent oxidoreductase [Actinomycetota bacterium]